MIPDSKWQTVLKPKIDWLNGELTHVMTALSSRFKNLFGSQEKAAKSYAVGSKEEWIGEQRIILPKP